MELLWKIVSAVILALVEGITEFLPISSTGHMILVKELLDLDVPPGGVFEIFIQFGAILSICVIYFDYLWKVTKAVPFNPNARRFAFGLVLAFLPAAFLGVLLSDFITTYLFSKYVVAVSLVLGGFAILYIERLVKIPQYYSVEEFPLSLYLKIGLCQCLALVPGVSRSGATIVAMLALGVHRAVATEFAFLVGIPTILAAGLYKVVKALRDGGLDAEPWGLVALGCATSAVVSFVVVRWLLTYVQRHTFSAFGWYRIVFGGLILLTAYTGLVDWTD
jgi:undecaprenyl-diphosphatase